MKNNFSDGDRVSVSGFSDELGIDSDYHCSVDSEGLVKETVKPYQKKVLVTLDCIDGDSKATVRIWRSKLHKVS